MAFVIYQILMVERVPMSSNTGMYFKALMAFIAIPATTRLWRQQPGVGIASFIRQIVASGSPRNYLAVKSAARCGDRQVGSMASLCRQYYFWLIGFVLMYVEGLLLKLYFADNDLSLPANESFRVA